MPPRFGPANSPVSPAPSHAQGLRTRVVFTVPYTTRLSQDRAGGIRPTHLIAASPSALLDTLLMLTKQKILELDFHLAKAKPGGPSPISRQERQALEWEHRMAHARLKDVCRGAARPFTIVKKRVAGPFLERLKDLRVLGWHDPKMESAAAVIEDGVCGKLRDVRFRRAVIRTTGRKGYPHIIVREG